jgi:hypothetical protein
MAQVWFKSISTVARAERDSQREFLRPFRGIERNRAEEPDTDQKHGYRSS